MMTDSSIAKRLLLLDGGLGTTLEDLYGFNFSQDTPLWSSHLLIDAPETLRKAQSEFAQAGADIILTPTYQASHAGLRITRPNITDQEIVQILQSAVSISRDVSNGLVALSLGAYGAILQPSQEYSGEYGEVDENGLKDFHEERLSAFNLSSIDLIAFETIPRLDEVRAIKKIVDGSKPYWLACVFPKGDKLPDGSSIESVVDVMMGEPRPWAIGINCTKIGKVSALVLQFEEAAAKLKITLPRLVVYPDGTDGQIYDTAKQIWVGQKSEDDLWHSKMKMMVEEIVDRGMWEGLIVGGCCKTLPKHIRALRDSLSPYERLELRSKPDH